MPPKVAPFGAVVADNHGGISPQELAAVTKEVRNVYPEMSRDEIQMLLVTYEYNAGAVITAIADGAGATALDEWGTTKAKPKKKRNKKKKPKQEEREVPATEPEKPKTAAAPAAAKPAAAKPAAAKPAPVKATPAKPAPAKVAPAPVKVTQPPPPTTTAAKKAAATQPPPSMRDQERAKLAQAGQKATGSGMRQIDLTSLMSSLQSGQVPPQLRNGPPAAVSSTTPGVPAVAPTPLNLPSQGLSALGSMRLQIAQATFSGIEQTHALKWQDAKAQAKQAMAAANQALREREMRLMHEIELAIYKESTLLSQRKAALNGVARTLGSQGEGSPGGQMAMQQLEAINAAATADMPSWARDRFVGETTRLLQTIAQFGLVENVANPVSAEAPRGTAAKPTSQPQQQHPGSGQKQAQGGAKSGKTGVTTGKRPEQQPQNGDGKAAASSGNGAAGGSKPLPQRKPRNRNRGKPKATTE